MPSPVPVFAVNLGATPALTGVSWFVQVVHYPLFAQVAEPRVPAWWTRSSFLLPVASQVLMAAPAHALAGAAR